MFSKGSSSSTSRAMVTPSLVMVGAPNFLSMTTLRPLGPSVTLTVSASLLTPASRPRRAASSNFRIFDISTFRLLLVRLLLQDFGEDVATGEDEKVLAVDGDLGAAVLRVDDGVTDLDVDGDELARGLGAATGSGGEHLALLWLLLGGVGDDQPGGCGLLGLSGADDNPVLEGVELHTDEPPVGVSTLTLRVLTIAGPAPPGNRPRRAPGGSSGPHGA